MEIFKNKRGVHYKIGEDITIRAYNDFYHLSIPKLCVGFVPICSTEVEDPKAIARYVFLFLQEKSLDFEKIKSEVWQFA